jgi:predicted secreted protein
MTVGVGVLGRDVILTVAGQAILGTQTKGLSCNNELIDVSDDAAGGWRLVMARPGLKTVDIAISGVLKNLELMRSFFNAANSGSQVFAVSVTYPDGSIVAGNFALATFNETGESNAGKTFDSSWQSTGALTFTAGTGG